LDGEKILLHQLNFLSNFWGELHGFFFFLGKVKEKKSIKGQNTSRTAETPPLKKSKKGQNQADPKSLMTILG
jgi:hypothetical protein